MSYSDSQPHFAQQPSYQSGSDAIGIWPQFSVNSNEQFDLSSAYEQQQLPPYKRAKHSDDVEDGQTMNSRMPLPQQACNLPVNRGVANIFFKTRVCAKFKTGTCRNGENCNFAHGMQDLRQPPPNWQELVGAVGSSRVEDQDVNWEDDQRIIHKMKLCKKFCNGEECPYGDRCNFLHEDPAKFRSDAAGGRFRESAAISIGTTGGMPMMNHGNGGGYNVAESVVRASQNGGGSDALRANLMKPVYWKTRLCSKFEITGHCPFGDNCHFAHGLAELKAHGGRIDGEMATQGAFQSTTMVSGIGNINTSPILANSAVEELQQGGKKKCMLMKWKGPKKINRIYGDWLDDLPIAAENLTNVES
ncbi:Zinc finger CCCH domain-containing protein 39 [Linum perenne]